MNGEIDRGQIEDTPERVEIEREKALQLYQATNLLLSDYPRIPVDALFFHGRAHKDDDHALFNLAAQLYHQGTINTIVLVGTEGERFEGKTPGEAWPGKTAWTKRLQERGVERIVYSPPAYHARQDDDAFLAASKDQGWKRAVALTHPHQLVRAMLGMVKVMQEEDYWMVVYGLAPQTSDWHKQVFGSQGQNLMPRFGHIELEFDRILRYQEKGHLASFDELFDYILRMRPQLAP